MVIPPVLHQHHVTGYDTMVERTRQLWGEGYPDMQIAEILSREGFRSARRETVLAKTVLKIRHRHHWVSPYHQHRLADKIEARWTIRGLARQLGVGREWVYNWILNGFLRESDVSRTPVIRKNYMFSRNWCLPICSVLLMKGKSYTLRPVSFLSSSNIACKTSALTVPMRS